MVGELMTLPLRVGVRATQLWLRAAEQTISAVVATAGRAIGSATSEVAPARRPESRYQLVDQPPLSSSVVEESPPAPFEPPPAEPPAPEPAHVSEEPELVEEVAEPGAEDGAGASVHIAAPWDGYDQMKAVDVVDRLAGANTAELAAVELYETGTKGRRTVLDAVRREMRVSNGSGSRS